MQYEFYLTDDCNRSCKFCKIPKKKFYATQNQAEEFYKIVQKEQEGNLDKYDLLFFGGEPLLNVTVLKHLVNLFKDDNRCIMHLTTNADFLDEFLDTKELARIDKVILSAYDIFKDHSKYIKFAKKIKDCMLTYTFIEDDINRVDDYTDLCYNTDVKFRAVTSHSTSSWNKIDENELVEHIFSMYMYQLEKCLDYFKCTGKFLIQEDARQLMKRLVQSMYYSSKLSDLWCTSCSKKSFYNGKFIGKCLMLGSQSCTEESLPQKCRDCKYRKACTRSCRLELKDGEVDKKLCCIEHTKFDAVCKFLSLHKNDIVLQKMIVMYII